MASLTRSQLKSSSNTTYTTNGVGDIDASEVRTFNDNLIESLITNDLTSSMNVLTSVSASYATIAGGVVGGIPSLASLNDFTSSQNTKNSTLASYTASNDSTNTSQNSRLTNLESTSASVNTSIANLNTFSASNGNASLNLFTSSANGRLNSLESQTSSYANSASVAVVDASQQSQINALIAATSSYATSSVSLTSLNDFTASQDTKNSTLATYTGSNDTKWNTLGGQTGSYVTSAITASSLVTASVNLNTITFTKGDTSTFNITVNTGSGTTTDLTSLNSFTASQDTKNLSVGYSTSSLNSFTSSNANTSLNSYTASQDTKNSTLASVTSSLNSATASLFTSASLGLTTASFSGNTITFKKGDGTTFGLVIPDISASAGTISSSAQIVELGFLQTSSFNSYTSSTNGRLTNIESTTASLLIETQNLELFSASALSSISQLNVSSASQQISIDSLNTNSGSVNSSITQLNASSASQQVSINALNGATASYATSAITASSLVTASFSGNTLTFTKGNGTTFGLVIPDVSGSTIDTGSFVTTASFNAYTTSQDTKNSTLATYTGSNDTKWSTISSVTSSLIAYTGSNNTKWSNLGSQSGSFITEAETGSFVKLDVANTFTQPQRINYSDGTGSLFTTDRIQTELPSTKEYGYRLKNQFGTSVVEMGQSVGDDSSGFIIVTSQNSGVTATIGKNGFVGRVDTTQFTASLAEGYVFVGDGSGKTSLVATSSFGGATPAGTVSSSAQITSLGFVSSSVTASSLITASVNLNTITFTKGDSSTFAITVNTGSAGTTIPAGTISGSQQITDLGFVSSSITASSLVTASFSGNTLTFTKGDASTFGVVIPDVSGSAATTIYDTVYTGESITKGDPLYISGSQGANPIVFKADAADPNKMPVTYVSNETIGAANTTEAIILGHIEGIDLTGYTAGQTIYVAEGGGWSLNLPSGSTSITQLLGVITKGGSGGKGLVLNPGPAQLPGLDTGKFWVGNGSNQPTEISSASFATTGSNVFTGEQTLSDEAGNTVTLSDISGSLVLVAKGATSGSEGLSNISASASTQTNLILKTNNNQSGSLTISGSGNILLSATAPTAGFRRYVGNQNIALTTALPQMTGSITYSPSVNFNYFNLPLTFRGPASSSTWNFNNNITNGNFNIGNSDATPANQAVAGGTMSNNMLLASVNYNAYTTPLVTSATFQNSLVVGVVTLTAFSSSIQANNNIFNGNSFAVNNSYFGTASTNAAQRLALSYNVFGGINSSALTVSGSNTTTSFNREVIGNTTNGSGIALGSVLNGDNSSLLSTLVHGSNLTVTGSTLYNTYTQAGSAFIGRNNSVNGTAARSGETVFAVGTGTSTSNRKTGFLIDSGSNTFIEGTLNVSGSTSFNGAVNITGSLTSSLTEGYVWVGGAGNVSTLVATSSFGGGSVPTGTVSSSAQITAFGFISSSTIPEGTVSSSAQIVAYNKFATTGSNTFTDYQIIKSNLTFQEPIAGEGSDNSIRMNSLNQSTLYIQNTSVSSGYASGSILQLTTATGSNGYGFSGSATFQMDAVYGGKTAKMQVSNINGVGTAVYGFADRVEFAKAAGFPNTPADTFRVDATAIELSGSIKVNTGSSGSAGIVSVGSGGTTVNNGLVTSNSIILATTQELGSGDEYPAVVSGKTNGSFTLNHNFGGSLNVAYLIINPLF